jgi:hypothetical protein
MSAISFTQLEDLCLSYTNILPFYGVPEKMFFRILISTGCRPSEIVKPNLWGARDTFGIVLNPLKGNNQRYISWNANYLDVKQYFLDNETYLSKYSVGKFNFIFDKFNTYGQLTKGNKGIDLYCFRTYYVKYLKFVDALQDDEIQVRMGWTNSHLPAIYYNSIINAE